MGDSSGVVAVSSGTAIVVAVIMCALVAVWTVALVVVDVEQRRLPDAWTLPAAGAALLTCVAMPIGVFGFIWPGTYLFSGRGIGGGDVKLAVPLGVAMALVGGAGAVLAAMLLASMFTVVTLLINKAKAMAHGPSMLAAAWIVVFASTFLTSI